MKKLLAIILSLCLMTGLFCNAGLLVSADPGDYTMNEIEPNSTLGTADRIYNNYTVNGVVSGTDMDYFKFTLSSRSTISIITLATYKSCFTAGVLTPAEDFVAVSSFIEYSSSGYPSYLTTATLNAGTYYYVIFNANASTLRNTYMFYFEYTAAGSSHTHTYTNDCDTTCNGCDYVRSTSHTYDADCDALCNVCYNTRTPLSDHTYTDACDTLCDECGQQRTAPHVYDSVCDLFCNLCDKRNENPHDLTDATCAAPQTCKVCGMTYGDTTEHTYERKVTCATLTTDGTIQNVCTVCGYTSSKVTTISYIKSITLAATSYTYDGKAKTPAVTVTDAAGNTLEKGADYTVTYASGHKDAGTYKVTVTLKGNYSGTKTLTFKIKPATLGSCTLAATTYAYNGKEKNPAVTVQSASGTKLTKNTHYTVTYASGRKNVGTYKVTIKGKGNYTGTKTLTFTIKPTTKTSFSIPVGDTEKIGASSNKKITYSCSNNKVATVNAKGVITAKATGTATITVKSNNITQKITVKVVKPSVKISGSKSVVIKRSLTLKATTNTSAKIKWSTSNKKVATVSSSGKVTGVKAGKVTIYAKITLGGKTYTASYSVTVKNPSLTLNKSSLSLSSGKTFSLVATANPKVTVKYKSSKTSVAKVSSSGKITAYAPGSAKITASFSYGGKTYSKTCTVKVTARNYSNIVLYEDSSVKITFKSAEKNKYSDDRVELYFNVKNKTGRTLLIQADAVALNGYSFCDLIMSDEVAAYSTGVINLSVQNFDYSLVSNLYGINSIGGQFRIINDSNWNSYDAIFKNVRLDGKGTASRPSFKKGSLVYSDSTCDIYYKGTEKNKYNSDRAEMYFYVVNKTNKTLLIQADVISVNGYSHNNLTMSDPVLAQSVGTINLSIRNFNFSSISLKNIKKLGGQLRIIDDATWRSYDAIFTNKTVK